MDVVCGRCRAEYEFDDALISERGTTVRCTNCGLQFKIFPPAGERPVELWRVYRAELLDRPVLEYESLEALQKGIARAAVKRSDWLARGEDAPRPLAEIIELQPLLGQRTSERPPDVAPVESSAGSEPRLGSSGTVIGVPTSDRLQAVDLGQAPPAPLHPRLPELAPQTSPDDPDEPADDEWEGRWVADDDVTLVPSYPPLGEQSLESGARPSDEFVPAAAPTEAAHELSAAKAGEALPRRRVRSALSQNKMMANEAASSAVRAQRASLLSRTFIGGTAPPVEVEPPSSGRRAASYPPPLPESAPSSPRIVAAVSPEAVPPSEQQRETPAATKPEVEPSTQSDQPDAPAPELIAPKARASHPDHTSSAGPSRSRMSSVSGRPRSATFSVVVVVVIAAAGGFLVWSQMRSPQIVPSRERAANDRAEAPTSSSFSRSPSSEATARSSRWVELESMWWINVLEGHKDISVDEAVVAPVVRELGAAPSWNRVNLLRAQGQLREARQMAMGLPIAGAEYALATLDLIETGEPPWALVRDRFKEAAVGEPAPYFARVGLVYATARSGNVLAARAEFENLRKMLGGSATSLFTALGVFLKQFEATTPLQDAPPTEERMASDQKEAPTPSPTTVTAQEADAKKKKDVPSGIKAKVERADTLWRGGNRDQAVVLYREVVAAIGTGHFLGQRSAARVAQAAREQGSDGVTP